MLKTTCPFTIIQAEVRHLEEAAILFDQYRQFYKQPSNLPAAKHFLFERTINKESVIYLAFEKQKAVGFMQLYPGFSSISLESVWILNDLYVLPEYRRQGVGRQLIETAMRLVKQREDKGLALSTAHDNHSAQGLYETLGFERDLEFWSYFWTRK
jgi:ribosomal protein S18 acetylase RimI-like enzyme